MHVDAGGAEAGDDGDHVVRRPARRERAQDDRDRLERLPRAVLRLELVLLLAEPDPLADLWTEGSMVKLKCVILINSHNSI